MNVAANDISSDSIDSLRSLLTNLQQKILNLRSIGISDSDIAKKLSLTKTKVQRETDRAKRLFARCQKLCPHLNQLNRSLLHAPIEILHLPEQTYQALRNVLIERVCDFYKRKITCRSLQYFPDIGKSRAEQVKVALDAINLPLADEIPDTAIYGLFDIDNHGIFEFDKPPVLNDRHVRLMYNSEAMFGLVAPRDVADEIDLDEGYHRQLIPKLKRVLNGKT